jgi:hypothetical protein
MKRTALAMALAAGFLVGGAIAQVPRDDKEPIRPRSIQLTAEQDHVIKEIVLKDMHIEQVPRSTEIKIGEKKPPNYRIADLSTTHSREGTASQNIQILRHRESDSGSKSAEHNCGHNQVAAQLRTELSTPMRKLLDSAR